MRGGGIVRGRGIVGRGIVRRSVRVVKGKGRLRIHRKGES